MLNATMEPSSFRAEELLSAVNLGRADSAVNEIFKVMFGFEIAAIAAEHPGSGPLIPDELTAIVGFSGAMRGSCRIRISREAARSIASAMLGGMPVEENDASINDALGELCNMLAGGWKNEVPELASRCSLSPPTVISGSDYKVHLTSRPSVNLSRSYGFNGHIFSLALCCEETMPK